MVPRFSAVIVLAVALGAGAVARVGSGDLVRAAGGRPDRFRIVSCSLGCSTGEAVDGAVVGVPLNPEVRIELSQAVDWTTLGPPAFQVFAAGTGVAPAASLLLDPDDPSTLIWRPRVTFDVQGHPAFGLSPGGSYQLHVPGTLVDAVGPYLTSVHGLPLEDRLTCTFSATEGVRDYVPGPPVAEVTLSPSGPVEVSFDDVMYLGTLVAPATGRSSSIHVGRAPDPVADPIGGSFSFAIDLERHTTTLTFAPDQALSAGEEVLVRLDPSITDLAGNGLRNPGTFAFVTAAP